MYLQVTKLSDESPACRFGRMLRKWGLRSKCVTWGASGQGQCDTWSLTKSSATSYQTIIAIWLLQGLKPKVRKLPQETGHIERPRWKQIEESVRGDQNSNHMNVDRNQKKSTHDLEGCLFWINQQQLLHAWNSSCAQIPSDLKLCFEKQSK